MLYEQIKSDIVYFLYNCLLILSTRHYSYTTRSNEVGWVAIFLISQINSQYKLSKHSSLNYTDRFSDEIAKLTIISWLEFHAYVCIRRRKVFRLINCGSHTRCKHVFLSNEYVAWNSASDVWKLLIAIYSCCSGNWMNERYCEREMILKGSIDPQTPFYHIYFFRPIALYHGRSHIFHPFK